MSEEKYISVKKVVEITKGKLIYGNENIICKTFSKDTRKINENDTYLGIKGENFNGSNLYIDALEKGAKVCILQDVEIDIQKIIKYKDIAIIKVDDVVIALQKIAEYKRSLYNIPVVGITGSVGKTSTKDIISSVMSRKYKVLKTQGNLNNQIGLPLTVLGLKDEDALVVEMGMGELGEISNLTKIAKPDVAVITNVGTSHIGNLGSRENILKAKLEIIEGLKENGTLVINNDNDMLHKWNEEEKLPNVITFGIDEKSKFMAQNITLNENSSNYEIELDGKNYNMQINIGGKHFVYNSLCAIAVGTLFDISIDEIKKGIANFELTKSRMEILKKDNITIINDCYNASLDSMKASIEYLKSQNANGGRKIAILGDMLELGDFSKELHEKVGKVVAENEIDILITVGEEAKYIAKAAICSGMNEKLVYKYKSNLEAIEKMKSLMKDNDVVLVKASNGMNFKQIVEAI